ncbi:MAG TPA: DUF1638 domain-containing protein [Candidatus Methylacidiphilales bacterium]
MGATLLPRCLVVVTCEVLKEEVQTLAKDCPHITAVEIMEMNLHEKPLCLKETLQKKITEVEARYEPDAIALVYGLCGCGLVGIRAQTCPVVVARAHDCITLFLGGKERYLQRQKEHPETYWFTPGWNTTGRAPGPDRFEKLKKDFIEKFGEEDAAYLIEQEMRGLSTYHTGVFIDLGFGDASEHETYAKKCVEWMGWKFQRETGNRELLADLLAGRWDEQRFLYIAPGYEIQHSADDRIMKAVPVAHVV